MYTDVKSVQILIALLKSFGIKHLVLSPGNRNVPFVHSVENDKDFECYSITDERSAGFFAIGLIHKYNEPVGICCTSGTAVCNYASAVNEAFYQKLPLVVITADRNPYYLNQLEDQMIPQMSIFRDVCKASVQLPMIENKLDEWKCINLVNMALLELEHHGSGPVHINVPIESGINSFHCKQLPSINKINRITALDLEKAEELFKRLNHKRVMVLYGQSKPCNNDQICNIEKFVKGCNAIIAVDMLSNLDCEGCINTFNASRILSENKLDELLPDIVISVNGNFLSYIRTILKNNADKVEHWIVSETGNVQDPFHCLSTIIEEKTDKFFEKMSAVISKVPDELGSYYVDWKKSISNINFPNIPYSDILVTEKLINKLKEGDYLHLANSSSVRIAQHFKMPKGVVVDCNRGTNGIDGSMSSFIGEAYGDKAIHYLLIGDLSFFYDMNALWNRYIGKNIRILLNNNEGAEIFHFTVGTQNVPTLNKHIAAEHFYNAKGWAETVGMEYISVSNEDEIDKAMERFVDCNNEKPILMEVFTRKEDDAQIMKKLYSSNKPKTIKSTFKNLLINR